MSDATAIYGGRLVLPDRVMEDGGLVLNEGKIEQCGPSAELDPPPGAGRFNAAGLLIFPGLIDTHVHGGWGDDVMSCGPEGLHRISSRFSSRGVTAWLPSTISARHQELLRAVGDCVTAAQNQPDGARIAGIHVEGPYINLRRKGAQPEEGIRDPDFDEVEELLQFARGTIRIMTLAPELPGGFELIERLQQAGVVASLGHSDADFDTAVRAIEAGASHATHLFNAMPPIHHRDPGLITACLNSPRVTAEVIPDGVHLHPSIVRLILRSKPAELIALITDAFSATGLEEGIHWLGPQQVEVKGSHCTLKNGTIAGSIINMDDAVRNAIDFADITLPAASVMGSLVPARLSGLEDRKGSLRAGKDADVAIFTPNFRCVATWVEGRLVHRAGVQ